MRYFSSYDSSAFLADSNSTNIVQKYDERTDTYLKWAILGSHGIDAHWQEVHGILSHRFLVYSAYYDKRDTLKPVIKVIGITRGNFANWLPSQGVICRLYFEEGGKFKTFVDVKAQISLLGETPHNEFYTECDVLCPLKGTEVPESVSIIPSSSTAFHFIAQSQIKNRLPVINARNGGTGTLGAENTEVGVCVKPLWSTKTIELIEFIELNKLLGASKLFIYFYLLILFYDYFI